MVKLMVLSISDHVGDILQHVNYRSIHAMEYEIHNVSQNYTNKSNM